MHRLNYGEAYKPFRDLSFLDTSSEDVSEDMILKYLAQIISEMYLREVHGFTDEHFERLKLNQELDDLMN